MAFGDFIQGVYTDNPGSPSGVSVGTVTVGNLLIAAFSAATNSTATVTDNLGNTWAAARVHYSTGQDYKNHLWYAIVTTGGACTITITVAGGFGEAIRAEFAGPFAASPLDPVNSGEGSSTSASSGTITPSVTGVLGIGHHVGREPTAFTSTDSWVTRVDGNVATNAAVILQSQVRADTTAFAATASLSPTADWISVLAAFKPAPAPAPDADPFSRGQTIIRLLPPRWG